MHRTEQHPEQHPEPPGLDLPAVLAHLDAVTPGLLTAPVTASLVAGGRSNLTYLLDDATGRRVVLRRPPMGHVLATAHDMAREHRVIGALDGSGVPVPRALALCTDPEVTGAPFYVMSHVEGTVVRGRREAAAFDAAGRADLARAMVDVLADLHAVDPQRVGLDGFGRPEGYTGRQVRRWSTQLAASRSRDVPGIEDLRDGLLASVPAAGPGTAGAGSVVHGDYRLDNLVVTPAATLTAAGGRPAVRAVLDWEMATLGDPLADVGLLLAYWDGLGRVDNPVARGIGAAAGFPDGDTLARWYADRSGRDLTALPWFVAFGLFKIAVVLEGIHYRFVTGGTVGDGFDRIGEVVPPLVALGRDALAAAGH